ncbi:MAG: hypothetical protein MUF80_03080 [Burkholderiales bacterium]|jgi:hypothetical protein|nr:hypothetical protein [Burkholderiales bacterium]
MDVSLVVPHHVTDTVNLEDAVAVHRAIREILERRYPGSDFAILDQVFEDVRRLFAGEMAGFQACDTKYHDLRHTLDIALAMARLIDGHDRASSAAADALGPERALIGIIAALFHDSGYILENHDQGRESGAEYTLIHVSRSARVLARYLPGVGLGQHVGRATRLVHFTGYEIPVDRLELPDPLDRRLGCMLGSADLIGQMADRIYLEKCRDFLYEEFVLAGIAKRENVDGSVEINYSSAVDLLAKTPGFYENVAKKRLDGLFGGLHEIVATHFGGVNPYRDRIERNIAYLKEVLARGDFDRLRRKSVTLSVAKDPRRRSDR